MWPICLPLVKFPPGTLTCNGSHASGICHVTYMSFCTSHYTEKARPCLIPPSRPQTQFSLSPAPQNLHPQNKAPFPQFCLQRLVPVARTQTHWWQRKGDVIRRLTTAAHFTAIINICTWVWGHKRTHEAKIGLLGGGPRSLFLIQFGANLSKSICGQLMGYSNGLCCKNTNTNLLVHIHI